MIFNDMLLIFQIIFSDGFRLDLLRKFAPQVISQYTQKNLIRYHEVTFLTQSPISAAIFQNIFSLYNYTPISNISPTLDQRFYRGR